MNSRLSMTVATARRALAAVAWASASGSPASMAIAVKLRLMLGDLVAAVVSCDSVSHPWEPLSCLLAS
jgi:hypothetical protein